MNTRHGAMASAIRSAWRVRSSVMPTSEPIGAPISRRSGGIPVSERLFARRTTTAARLTDDAEAMENDLDPVLCTVGPATAHRRPYAIQLLGRLFPTVLPSPAGPTFRLSATELLPFRERGIAVSGGIAVSRRNCGVRASFRGIP